MDHLRLAASLRQRSEQYLMLGHSPLDAHFLRFWKLLSQTGHIFVSVWADFMNNPGWFLETCMVLNLFEILGKAAERFFWHGIKPFTLDHIAGPFVTSGVLSPCE